MDYLVVGDSFSKFLFMRKIPNSSTQAVIKELGMIFTEFGRPFVLKNDNGPWYTSREFHDFLEFYKIHHITSSPHYPQSSGFAEALVGILKKLMEKSVKDEKPWNYGLLEYRVTPESGIFHHLWRLLLDVNQEPLFPRFLPVWKLEFCGKFQDPPGIKTAQYFNTLFYGTPGRTACICERNDWKCMENWCSRPTSKGT